jgi:hypothetical protein
MKLRFGKAGWIELDQMPLASHVVESRPPRRPGARRF